jgi:hypothetical protein
MSAHTLRAQPEYRQAIVKCNAAKTCFAAETRLQCVCFGALRTAITAGRSGWLGHLEAQIRTAMARKVREFRVAYALTSVPERMAC